MIWNQPTLVLSLAGPGSTPWASGTASPNNPDYIGIDVDASDDDFGKVVQTALALKELFDKLKLTSFVKTSGKTGMHLYLPCSGIERTSEDHS